MNTKEKAKILNERWSRRKDGKLMKSLFLYVCDDLELLEELYKNDKENYEILELLKEEAETKYNGDFKKLYENANKGDDSNE